MPSTLTLNSDGPTPDPLTVPRGDRAISITNALGYEVVLTLIPAGFLNPSSGNTLSVPTTGWSGQVGASGTFEYTVPDSREKATRSGRINVG